MVERAAPFDPLFTAHYLAISPSHHLAILPAGGVELGIEGFRQIVVKQRHTAAPDHDVAVAVLGDGADRAGPQVIALDALLDPARGTPGVGSGRQIHDLAPDHDTDAGLVKLAHHRFAVDVVMPPVLYDVRAGVGETVARIIRGVVGAEPVGVSVIELADDRQFRIAFAQRSHDRMDIRRVLHEQVA